MVFNFKRNQKIIMLILGLVIITLVALFFLKKSSPTPSSVKNIKAKFTALGDGTPVLQISYTNPSSFGEDGTEYKGALVYLLECPQGTCPDDIVHPTITQLTTGNIYKPVFITNFDSSTNPTVPSGNVIANLPLTSFDTPPVPNYTYKIGIGLMNDKRSIFEQPDVPNIPNIYGNFSYITVVYGDAIGPGKINSLSSKFITI